MTNPTIDTRPLAIALMGPTASGKTALAVEWAQRLGGEIVSVDSALVYRGMDIGSAKPDASILARAPHHLLDLRDPHEPYSAADFAIDARTAMDAIHARRRIPLLVGGTGLYFRALLDGLSPMPASDPAMRARLLEEGAARGWPALHAELAAVDPEAGVRIGPADTQRIARALEVWRLSGRAISDWQGETSRAAFPFRVLKLVLAPQDRSLLHARIEARFETMLADGFLDEMRRLRADPRLHPDLPSMRAVGYRQAWRHLDAMESPSSAGRGVGVREGSDKDLAVAKFRAEAIAATRQLAKRQLTWLRGELDARWFDSQSERAGLEAALVLFLGPRSRA